MCFGRETSLDHNGAGRCSLRTGLAHTSHTPEFRLHGLGPGTAILTAKVKGQHRTHRLIVHFMFVTTLEGGRDEKSTMRKEEDH